MRIISLDLSTKSSGYAIFEEDKLIGYGLIQSNKTDWRERLYDMGKTLGTLFDLYKPEHIYIEDVPLNPRGGVKTAVMLGAVQGIIYGAGASREIEMSFILPSTWRSPLGLFDGSRDGTRRDELKRKSIEKANELFKLDLIYKSPASKQNQDDISDAILLGYSQIKPRAFGKKS